MENLKTFNILSNKFNNNPYEAYLALRTSDKIFYDPDLNAYFVSKYDDIASILSNPLFTTEPLAQRAEPVMRGRVLAQMEGKEHNAKRKVLAKNINSNEMRKLFTNKIFTLASNMLKPLLQYGRFDFINDFGKDFAVLVTLDLLDLPKENYKEIRSWHKGITDVITSITPSQEIYSYGLECSQKLADFILPIIEQRIQNPGQDLISAMCSAELGENKMSPEEVLALCLNILLAAAEPADKTIALMLKNLIEHPQQFSEVRHNRSLIKNLVHETLRLNPPVQLIPRQAAVDIEFELSGVKIPKGSLIFCLIGSANRDEDIFNNSNEFNIHRTVGNGCPHDKGKHLAFGYGMHTCIGAAFSLMQIEIVMNIILDNTTDIKFTSDFIYREVGLYTRGPASLMIDVTV